MPARISHTLRQKILRRFEAGKNYCTIAYEVGVTWQCVAGAIAAAQHNRERNKRTGIRALVVVRDPEAYLRAKRVDYRRCG